MSGSPHRSAPRLLQPAGQEPRSDMRGRGSCRELGDVRQDPFVQLVMGFVTDIEVVGALGMPPRRTCRDIVQRLTRPIREGVLQDQLPRPSPWPSRRPETAPLGKPLRPSVAIR